MVVAAKRLVEGALRATADPARYRRGQALFPAGVALCLLDVAMWWNDDLVARSIARLHLRIVLACVNVSISEGRDLTRLSAPSEPVLAGLASELFNAERVLGEPLRPDQQALALRSVPELVSNVWPVVRYLACDVAAEQAGDQVAVPLPPLTAVMQTMIDEVHSTRPEGPLVPIYPAQAASSGRQPIEAPEAFKAHPSGEESLGYEITWPKAHRKGGFHQGTLERVGPCGSVSPFSARLWQEACLMLFATFDAEGRSLLEEAARGMAFRMKLPGDPSETAKEALSRLNARERAPHTAWRPVGAPAKAAEYLLTSLRNELRNVDLGSVRVAPAASIRRAKWEKKLRKDASSDEVAIWRETAADRQRHHVRGCLTLRGYAHDRGVSHRAAQAAHLKLRETSPALFPTAGRGHAVQLNRWAVAALDVELGVTASTETETATLTKIARAVGLSHRDVVDAAKDAGLPTVGPLPLKDARFLYGVLRSLHPHIARS